MNIFEYIPLMKEQGTPFAFAGVALLALFLVIIILKMLGGMRRGTWRQLVRTGLTLLSAIASYIAGTWLSGHIIGSLDIASLDGLINTVESYLPGAGDAIRDVLSSIDTDMVEYIILLPAAIIIIPVITTFLFLAINLVLKIVRAIVIKVIGLKRAKSNSQRLGGALLAAVEGIIWIIMVMLPICGALSLVDQAYEKAIDSADDESKTELIEFYDEYLLPFTSNPAIEFIDSLGTTALADGIATVTIENEKANMRDEVLSVAHIIIVDAGALEGSDFTNLTPENKEAIGSIVDALSASPFMSRILVQVVQIVPTVYESGFIPLDFGEEFTGIIDDLMTFLKSVERETLSKDLNTIKQFYFGFSDSGLISAMTDGEDIMQFISDDYKNDKHILGMINTLSGNPRTQSIVDGLYNFVLNAAFSGAMSSPDGEGEGGESVNIDITEVKNGINNIVSVNRENFETEEEYREVLADTIQTTINDTINVELEDDVVEEIANFVDENYSEQLGELTDEEFNEVIFEVIDIYQKYLNGEEINPDDLSGDLGDINQ